MYLKKEIRNENRRKNNDIALDSGDFHHINSTAIKEMPHLIQEKKNRTEKRIEKLFDKINAETFRKTSRENKSCFISRNELINIDMFE